MSTRQPLRRQFFNEHQIDQRERAPYPEYRYTKYFWTINLQRAAYTREQAKYLMNLIRQVVLEVFTSGDAVAFSHPNHRWNRTFVGHNELQVGIEVGPNKGRVHAHVIQEVKHRSIINIDPSDIKDLVDARLAQLTGGRITGVYVNRKHHDSAKVLEEYLDKDNTSWRDQGGPVSGIWAYTLRSRADSDTWDIIRSREEVVGRIDNPVGRPIEQMAGYVPVGANIPGRGSAGAVGRVGTSMSTRYDESFKSTPGASSSTEHTFPMPATSKQPPKVLNKLSKRSVK